MRPALSGFRGGDQTFDAAHGAERSVQSLAKAATAEGATNQEIAEVNLANAKIGQHREN